ncbi:hypothetical protein, partial [Avibacterium paragallinarum]
MLDVRFSLVSERCRAYRIRPCTEFYYFCFVIFFLIFGRMTFFFGSYNGFRSLSDLLSFAYPKESKQRKRYPTKLLFLIP